MTRYEDRSVEELRQLATEKEIEGRSSMSKADLIAALRGDGDGASRSGTTDAAAATGRHAPDKVEMHGLWDNDAKQVTHYFADGSASEQKDAVEHQIDRLYRHVGEGAVRDLRVVKIVEV